MTSTDVRGAPDGPSKEVWVLVVHGSGDGSALGNPRITEHVQLLADDWAAAAVDKLAAAGN